jgi:REP element-mobilizing transposase RayT
MSDPRAKVAESMRTICEPKKAKPRGGKRPGAGRPRSHENQRDPIHCARERLDPKHPVHVTLRVATWHDRLRNGRIYSVVHRALLALLDEPAFRICHVSIQHNHLHLIVEADHAEALSHGMIRFTSRVAKGINALAGYVGKVFPHRYHATQIRTSKHARSAIAYVLNNWRRHKEDRRNDECFGAFLDRYSSAITFDGWGGGVRWLIPEDYDPLPVAHPTSWLLRDGWRQHGEIDTQERPGPEDVVWSTPPIASRDR